MDATLARSGRCGCAARHLTANVVEEFAFFFFFSVGASRSFGLRQMIKSCDWCVNGTPKIWQRQFQPAHWFNEAARTARPQRLAANIDPRDSLWRRLASAGVCR